MNPIFYKEWLKTRLHLGLVLVVNLALAVYAALRVRYIYGQYDAPAVWNAWLFKGYAFFGLWQYLPLLSGIAYACVQFLPEVRDRRLRLVLHLPLGERRAVAYHLLFGCAALVAALLPALAFLFVAGDWWFPGEFLAGMALTLLPWLLAGCSGYLLAAAVLLEVRWSRRILLALLAAGVLRWFHLELSVGSYARIWPVLVLWTLGAFCLPVLSSERFRRGC